MKFPYTLERGVGVEIEAVVEFHRESDEFRSWWIAEVTSAVDDSGQEVELTEAEDVEIQEYARELSVREAEDGRV